MRALKAAGYPPGSKDYEMMLVGYSQGGMDAQNLAALRKYNVTSLVTYGSPLTQADQTEHHHRPPQGRRRRRTRHPPTFWASRAARQKSGLRSISAGAGLGNQIPLDSSLSGPSHLDLYGGPAHRPTDIGSPSLQLSLYHRQPWQPGPTPQWVQDFDHSNDPDLVAKQDDLARFQGLCESIDIVGPKPRAVTS